MGHEMATAVLPAFLVAIGGSSAALGLIEGIADFFSSTAKLGAGYLGGRIQHKKWAATGGYLVTALSKASFALATAWPHVLIGRIAGWLGRGFRSPLRDTLLAEQTNPAQFGRAYGLERAMDAIGAVIGPLVSLLLVALLIHVRSIFWLTLIPGVLSAGFMLFGVREKAAPIDRKSLQSTPLPWAFRRFVLAVGIFGLGDFSRTLLILWATGEAVSFTGARGLTLPIGLYVLYNVVSAASSYISGRRSDTMGRKPLLLFGYVVAVGVSGLLFFDLHSVPMMALVFVGSGVYMGVLEAVEKATAADLVAAPQRSWGFGVLATVTGVGDLVSSLVVGSLWQYVGPRAAFGYSAAAMFLGTIALASLVPAHASRS